MSMREWFQGWPIFKGGPGSGFHGHAGRPGQRGGSAAVETAITVPEFRTVKEADTWAQENLKTKMSGLQGSNLKWSQTVIETVAGLEAATGSSLPASIRFGAIKGKNYAHYDGMNNEIRFRKSPRDVEGRMKRDDQKWAQQRQRYGLDPVPFHAVPTVKGLVLHEIAHAYDKGHKYSKTIRNMKLEEKHWVGKLSGYASRDLTFGTPTTCKEAWAEAFSAVVSGSKRGRFVPETVKKAIWEAIG